jgi:hypothetical protein
MRRLDVMEIEDQPWCPAAIRDGGTDWLGFMANATKGFSAIAPLVRGAMERTKTTRVLDLCSGGGGPWPTLAPALRESGDVNVELTDAYPNLDGLKRLSDGSSGLLSFRESPIDATDVPEELDGVRTMFNCFHHFSPSQARAVIGDAVKKRRGIAIFEGCDNRAIGTMLVLTQLPALYALTPFVRPFKWSRIALTYVLPLIPGLVLVDGVLSMMRLYMADELKELVASVDGHESFDWNIGNTRVKRAPVGITHLVGVPKA